MTTSYYDVVLVGGRLSSLTAAALLAKRNYRVLVIGHDELPPTYEAISAAGASRSLTRAPSSFLPAHSPVARRIFSEIAIHQTFRRQATIFDPAFQVVTPKHRFDVPLDPAALEREVEREFREVRRPIESFLARAREDDEAIDRALSADALWPPEGFFERREHARAIAGLSWAKTSDWPDPLRELPESHPFRLVVYGAARFADGMDPDHTTGLRLVRHFASWMRGPAVLQGGPGTLRSLLVSSVKAHGGEIRERDRIDAILVKRGTASGVRIAASGEEIGASFVILGSDIGAFMRLLPDRRPLEELFERVGEPVVRYYRYTLNVVLAAEGVPEGMGREVIAVRDPKRPLSGANLLRVEAHPRSSDGTVLLTVEALLPRRGVEDAEDYLAESREHILAALGELVPFLGSHVVMIDSPHDGRPARDMLAGTDVEPPAKWARGPRTMEAVYGYPIASALGLCALPVRTPLKRLLLCSQQVAPGLGAEGELLAAWSAARVIGRADRRPATLRRSLWTKLEG